MLAVRLNHDFFLKFIKFGIVGFSGLLVDFGITILCKEKLKIHKYIANTFGFVFASVSNYLLNCYWTFDSKKGAEISQFGKFFIIALIGLMFNNLIIYLLNDKLKFNFYLSKFIAVGLVAIWNFYGNYLYSFAE